MFDTKCGSELIRQNGVQMKQIAIIISLFISSAVSFATPTAGNTLKAQVQKMKYCSGKYNLYGYDLFFSKEVKEVQGSYAQVLQMTIPSDVYSDEYTTDDAYAYTVGSESDVLAYTPWKVSGKQVLIYVKGDWMPLTIGFKSRTCWF
jgi:hypothetical protein